MGRQVRLSGKPLPTSRHHEASTLGNRINVAITRLGSLVRAGEIAGVSNEAVARWRDGESKPPFAGVVALCVAAGLSVEWMATGEGPRDIRPVDVLSLDGTEGEHMGRSLRRGDVLAEENEDAIALPQLTVVGSAGNGLIPFQDEIDNYLSVSRRYLREVGINPLSAHVLRLSGHSMFPTLQDRDLVIVDTSQTTVRDEEIYALAYGDAVLVKRLHPQWDGGLKIISDNKGGNYADAHVPAAQRDQVRIVGRVGGYLRYF